MNRATPPGLAGTEAKGLWWSCLDVPAQFIIIIVIVMLVY